MNKWVAGARPRTLPAAIAPTIVGSALAYHELRSISWLNSLLAFTVGISLQVAVNYANDYSDGIRGTDDSRVGPIRLVASQLATPQAVKRAAYFSFFIAMVAGTVLSIRTSLWLLLIGAFAIIAAWTYTGGSRPYGYRGYGELSVFIFFGVVATMGSYFVQTRRLTIHALVLACAMGALACSILVVNNLRDLPKDSQVGKRTLAVMLGDKRTRIFFISLLLVAHLLVLNLALSIPYLLTVLILLPTTLNIARSVWRGAVGRDLITVLGRTARVQALFALILALALLP